MCHADPYMYQQSCIYQTETEHTCSPSAQPPHQQIVAGVHLLPTGANMNQYCTPHVMRWIFVESIPAPVVTCQSLPEWHCLTCESQSEQFNYCLSKERASHKVANPFHRHETWGIQSKLAHEVQVHRGRHLCLWVNFIHMSCICAPKNICVWADSWSTETWWPLTLKVWLCQ